MNEFPTLVLASAAASVGALHTLAPDHWVPFAALARARGWSAARTARLTLLCGFGHVTVSVGLGLLALLLGFEALELFGRKLESLAGVLLIAFGLMWAIWGVRRGLQRKLHGHDGHHGHHGHHGAHGHHHGHSHSHLLDHEHHQRSDRAASWSLFVLFSADPCVAVIPLLLAAAPLGAARTTAVVATYEVATMATMTVLALAARAGVERLKLRGDWVARWGDGAAGSVIAVVGVAMLVLGL